MKALLKAERAYGARLADIPPPKAGPGEVLIKITAASICGTDIHIYTWDPWAAGRIKTPLVFGHEFSGVVLETGPGVGAVKPGDFVSAETHVVCNRCLQCLTGKAHVCRDYQIIGVDRPGCFAEFISIPAQNAWLNPPDLDPAVAALQEPLGNAVHTVFSGAVTAKTLLVTGCGPIGILAVGAARAAGASMIIAADLNDFRLKLAAQLGASHLVNSGQEDLAEAVLRLTGGQGVDVVLEMSGAAAAITSGLRALKNGGRMSMLGTPTSPVELDLAKDIIFKGLTLKGITGRSMFDTWFTTRGLLESGRLNVQPVITHRFSLEEYELAFSVAMTGNCGKVVVIP